MSVVIEIVKVQLPVTNDLPKLALVYAKRRQRMSQQKLSPETEAAMAGDHKAYFKAEYISRVWKIGERVKDQTW